MTTTTLRRFASAAIVLTLALGAGACSDDEEGTDDTGTEDVAEEGTEETAEEEAPAEEEATEEEAPAEEGAEGDYTQEDITMSLQASLSEEVATCVADSMFQTMDQERINEIATSPDAYATDEEYQTFVIECSEANGEEAPEIPEG